MKTGDNEGLTAATDTGNESYDGFMQGTCTIVNGNVCFEPYDRNLQEYLLIYLLIWCSQQRCYMWNQ